MALALIQPSSFVGRDRELSQLGEALTRALSGSGSVVCVRGEAGVGKTRLLLELAGRCRDRGLSVHRAECCGRDTPLIPWLDLLRSIFDVSELEDEYDLRREVAGELALIEPGFHEDLPLVFDLLGISDPERPSGEIGAGERRERLESFVRRLLRGRGARAATVLVVDDLDAIDPMSEALLRTAAEATPGTPTLLLVGCGVERRPPWLDAMGASRIDLAPLPTQATRDLVTELLGTHASTAGLVARIAATSGGRPWMARESVRWLADTGVLTGEPGDLRCGEDARADALTDDVGALLADRFSRLGESARRTLEVASVVGMRVGSAVLGEILEDSQEALDSALAELCRAGILFQSAAEHRFEHRLYREHAYAALDPAQRAKLHADVALAIEEIDFERLDAVAGLLAHHWAQAGQSSSAQRWWRHAAQRAGFEHESPG